LKGRNQVRAGKFGAGPREHFAGDFETAIAGGGSGRFPSISAETRMTMPGTSLFKRSACCNYQRPDADQDGDRWLAAKFFQEIVPVLGVEERLGHGEMRAASTLAWSALFRSQDRRRQDSPPRQS